MRSRFSWFSLTILFNKEMLAVEAALGLLSAFPLHNWLIKFLLSHSMPFWITVTACGACLLHQGFTRLQDNVNEEEKEEEKGEGEEEERISTDSGDEEDDSETDEDSSAWMTVNDSEED